ncbi:MAG TPA: nucleoside deaminase [Polyangiaceae bacterium]|jgi:tRNA(adenine34) deaminase
MSTVTERVREDEAWMSEALVEADAAALHGDVPIGCVVVDSAGQLLAREHNRREQLGDPTAHAEILALRTAAAGRGHWRLDDATLFVTLEPCPMCAGALINARIARVVYAASDPKAGAVRTLFQIGTDARLNHRFEITADILSGPSVQRLRAFFGKLRAAGER